MIFNYHFYELTLHEALKNVSPIRKFKGAILKRSFWLSNEILQVPTRKVAEIKVERKTLIKFQLAADLFSAIRNRTLLLSLSMLAHRLAWNVAMQANYKKHGTELLSITFKIVSPPYKYRRNYFLGSTRDGNDNKSLMLHLRAHNDILKKLHVS